MSRSPVARSLAAAALLALCLSCQKVPLWDINAGFTLADATWFAQEQTLFVFYRMGAEQGLSEASQIELSYRTDDEVVDWTPLAAFAPVHEHLPVDCGTSARCGSASLRVPLPPRDVRLRLRYHRDGELALDAPLALHVVGVGPAHTHRSLIVYGVFDAQNAHVQWRARHQFPALRNEEAQALGLRRAFRVTGPGAGEIPTAAENPYSYGFAPACPSALAPLAGHGPVETNERAKFSPDGLPLSASAAPAVCALSSVTDATGTFEAATVARKNPEVRAAFPTLHSPAQAQLQLGYLLRFCERTISEAHLQMLVQRMQLAGAPEICLDEWTKDGFEAQLAATFRNRFDEGRLQGKDMVLVLGFQHDDTTGKLPLLLERALATALAPEETKSSPRVSGAFVLDTVARTLVTPAIKTQVLWCPANLDGELGTIPDSSQRSCPLLKETLDLNLGPFRFSQLPILATRTQYETFISRFSAEQAGRTLELKFLAPRRTPLSQDLRFGEFGSVTFFNNEVITAEPTDAFSYCAPGNLVDTPPVVFRSAVLPVPLPLQQLPEFHANTAQPAYPIGLFWQFPFFTRLRYGVGAAGAVTAFSLTIPFGTSAQSEAPYGAQLWETEDFQLSELLKQCTRFCTHPTFDNAGVYGISEPFNLKYAQACYAPHFPTPDEGGFPSDP